MESPYNKENTVIVYTAKLARFLLHNNYTIIDLKPNKDDPNRTVFFFKKENNIEQYILNKNKKETKTWQNDKEYPTKSETVTSNGNQMN